MRLGEIEYAKYVDGLLDDDATRLQMDAARLAGEELNHLMGDPRAANDNPLQRQEYSVSILQRALNSAQHDLANARRNSQ